MRRTMKTTGSEAARNDFQMIASGKVRNAENLLVRCSKYRKYTPISAARGIAK
jgi:hypothetical protein